MNQNKVLSQAEIDAMLSAEPEEPEAKEESTEQVKVVTLAEIRGGGQEEPSEREEIASTTDSRNAPAIAEQQATTSPSTPGRDPVPQPALGVEQLEAVMSRLNSLEQAIGQVNATVQPLQ